MPRQQQNNRRRQDDDRNDRGYQRNSGGSRRSGGRQQRRQQQSTVYHPILQLFALDKGDRISINIKPIATDKASIEDVLTLEQWLFLCEQLYYGEFTLTGSLWESSIPQADWTGNVRLSGEQLEELLEAFENSGGKKTKGKQQQSKPKSSSRSRYDVPDEPEDEQEEDYEEQEDDGYPEDADVSY